MLNLTIQLEKKGRSYQAFLIADEGGKELHRDNWGKIVLSNKLTRRVKIVQLNKKNLGICLNIMDATKDFTKKKSFEKKTKKKVI